MSLLNKYVKVNYGRNKGLFGSIIAEDKDNVLVKFAGKIYVNGDFYDDIYWVKNTLVEVQPFDLAFDL